MATPTQRRLALRQLLAGPDMVVVPEAVNAAVGRLIEEAGFPMAYIGGAAQCLLNHALPDYGLLSPAEMLDAAARIANELAIPVLVDADQGGETYLNVRRTIQCFEQSGVAGLHLEDSVNPKHVGGACAPPLEVAAMCARIRAAVDARQDASFVVIARTDLGYNALRGGEGAAPFSLQQAIDRACAYAEAGADGFFSCLTPPTLLKALVQACPVPLIDINHPMQAARDAGLRLDIFAGQLGPALVATADRLLRQLSEQGFIDRAALQAPAGQRERLQRNAEYLPLARDWLAR